MLERRDFKGGCEIRSNAAGKPVIAGYASVFNSRSHNLGGFIEQVDPRAFDKTIREADVRAMGNHDVNWLLGRTANGTLRLSTDTSGLHYEVDVNTNDPDGQRALAKVERGDWDGSSFGFRTIKDDWKLGATPRERRLLEVELRDVGPVTFPAYPETSTSLGGAARSLASALGVEVRDVEAALEADGIDALIDARAVWTTAYMDDLPDSAFLYVEPGGSKDGEGKTTPRSLRHFPVRDANGAVDLAHVRNALARIPQSDVPQAAKDAATAEAKRLLAQHETNSILEIFEDTRAGKVLSAASITAIKTAIDQLENLIDSAAGLPEEPEDQPDGETVPADDQAEEQASADQAEQEERLRSLLARRYHPSQIAA